MRRIFFTVFFILISSMLMAQQGTQPVIFGRVPAVDDSNLYQIQVGAFMVMEYAETAFDRLRAASLDPVYEEFMDFTRVIVRGIRASQAQLFMEKLYDIGFSEIFIRVDTVSITAVDFPAPVLAAAAPVEPAEEPAEEPVELAAVIIPAPQEPVEFVPLDSAVLPSRNFKEVAHRTISTGETASLTDLVSGENILSWTSSSPQAVTVDEHGNITGRMLGNAFVMINETEYVSVAVVPEEDFFVVSESMTAFLLPESSSSSSTMSLTEYRTEPTFRLAYRWNNRGENRGASGRNGGIDILGRGADYQWLWTTFFQGGWFYNLNGEMRTMIDGFQRDARGVELRINPLFIYDRGVPYLELRHVLTNTGSIPLSGQRFGASADVMIHDNDYASLILTPYGAYMADSTDKPSLELMFICLLSEGITPVDTLWLGTYMGGAHLDIIYNDRRSNVNSQDSAIAFSYQNIDLEPGESKEFIVRFTLARSEE